MLTVMPGPFDGPPAFPATNVYDWAAFYLGINDEGGFESADWTHVPDITGGWSDASGGLIGGAAEYNVQAGDPFVLGAGSLIKLGYH
jgi:hypothetical protein